MAIIQVKENKKKYLDLLLLADEQESMVDLYLNRGDLYVLQENSVKAVCVVTDEGNGVLEIKNLATAPEFQKKGYARQLIDYVASICSGRFSVLQVGTGDSPLTVPFYEKCGFTRSHVKPNFFVDHYDHPIFECGKQLVDMVYLRKRI